MKYYLDIDDKKVSCPHCGWTGTLGQTDDQDVLDDPHELTCVCPKCGTEVVDQKFERDI